MTTRPNPEHFSNRHKDTLKKLFEHPTSYNIEWREVASLFESIGTAEHRHDGKFKVTLGSNSEVFERPKGKDVDIEEIVVLRKMLREAGYGAE
ncbi:MAG: hypothetical protein WB770_08655 [Acidimicrobiales bacterium]